MIDGYGENEQLRDALLRLLEAETGEDSMICHDGGFRYSGDFMSMERELVEPAALISETDYRRLRDRGLIVDDGPGIRVTEAGRRLAFGPGE